MINPRIAFSDKKGKCILHRASARKLIVWLPDLWNKNNHSERDLSCVPESPAAICRAFRGSPEWQTSLLVWFSDSPLPSSEQTCGIQSFLLSELSWDHSPLSSQLLFCRRNAIPGLHIHVFNWAEAILKPPFLPCSPIPCTGSQPLWLWSQGRDCFVWLMLFLLFSSQPTFFLSFK